MHWTQISDRAAGDVVICYMHVAEQGGSLKLCAVGPRIRDVLVATSLNTVIHMFETEAEALRSF